ncbi:30S ribosomal protein S13 [Geodia barretti]|uniref:30S ribosomal protein S13 n=1 Tax=Geodia barretti TaxID=519541 RepID=A0AA35RAW8_GEOBA|nr:30S ribosomal protein S13 [Geodia barretti]
MAIISGVNIPDNKRVEISLRSIYGIGPYQAKDDLREGGGPRQPKGKRPVRCAARSSSRDCRP